MWHVKSVALMNQVGIEIYVGIFFAYLSMAIRGDCRRLIELLLELKKEEKTAADQLSQAMKSKTTIRT